VEEGVANEIERLNHVFNEDPIKVKKLYKIYPNGFHALKGITFGVEEG